MKPTANPWRITKLPKGFTLVELLVVIAIIAALAALSTPVILKQQKKAASTQAINNAKQIFLLLFEYDQEKAAYPSVSGTKSNRQFRTLIAEGYTTSEDIFYAKTNFSKKPDGNIIDTEACTDYEVGFLYVKGLSSGSISSAPLVAAPQSESGVTLTFDQEIYGGRAIVLTNDGAARSLKINSDGKIFRAGADILVTVVDDDGGAITGPDIP